MTLSRAKLKNSVENRTDLTHRTQRCDSSIVLPRQVLLVANRAHAVSPWVTVETTPSGTQHRNWALIGLLGHRDVFHLYLTWRHTLKYISHLKCLEVTLKTKAQLWQYFKLCSLLLILSIILGSDPTSTYSGVTTTGSL